MKPSTVSSESRQGLNLSIAEIGAALVGSGVGVVAFALGYLLRPARALSVNEPLASELVLEGAGKVSDFIVPVAAAVLGALVALALLRTSRRRAILPAWPESKAAAAGLTAALAVAGSGLLSGVSSLALLGSGPSWSEFTATPPALGVAVLVLGLLVVAGARSGHLARVSFLWWLCLVAAWLAVAAVAEIVVGSLAAVGVLVTALLWTAAVLRSGRERWAAAVHARLLPIAVALPFLLGAERSTSRQWLAVGLAIGVAGAVAFFDRAWAGPVDDERLSPLAVGSMSVLAISSLNPLAHPLSHMDLFHAGEKLVQFQLISEGLLPYLDFVPYPSTVFLAVSTLGAATFGGPIVGFVPAYHVMAAGVAFAVATLLTNRAGPLAPALPWACMVLVASSGMDRVWPAAILLAAVTARPVSARSWSWPLGWFAGGVATVALVPALGTAAVLATIPYGLTASLRSLRRLWRDRDVWRAAVLAVGVAAVAVVAMPIVAMLVTEGAANTLAWGRAGRVSGIGIYLMLGAAGTIVSVVVAVVAVRMDRPRSLAVPLALFSLAAVPYMWGRIDSGLSRSGLVSIVLLAVFLPVVINEAWPRADATLRAIALAPGVLIVGVLLPFSLPAVADGLVARPEIEPTPAVEASALRGLSDEELRQDLLTQRDALRLAAGDGTAWDMASRLTLWPLADVLPASRFGSSIYAATRSQQQEVLRDFEARPPAAVLIAPRERPIPVSPALRSYLPYRWLMQQQYEPVVIDDDHFYLLSPERFSEVKRSEDSERLQEATYADLAVFTGQADLQSLPASWAGLSGLGPVPTRELSNVDGRVVAGTDERADVLVVTAQCPSTAPGSYRTSTNAIAVTEFEAVSGRMVLPLGHDPTWLMAHGERRVELVTGCEISEVFFARI